MVIIPVYHFRRKEDPLLVFAHERGMKISRNLEYILRTLNLMGYTIEEIDYLPEYRKIVVSKQRIRHGFYCSDDELFLLDDLFIDDYIRDRTKTWV